MPVIINEIVIRTNIEKGDSSAGKESGGQAGHQQFEEIVQEAVKQVLEIIEEKKQR